MDVILFAIHRAQLRVHASANTGKACSQKRNVLAVERFSSHFRNKDQVHVERENARPATSDIILLWPSWHRPVYNISVKRQQAYKYRLNVRDRATATHLSRLVGCCRFVWNRALGLSKDKYPGFKALCAMLPAWKKELPWLAECDSIALQQVLRNFDRAWQNFFQFPESFDRPVAKHRFVHDSFRVVGAAASKTGTGRIWLPKHGWLSFRASRAWQGKIKGYVISRKANRWYVSLQCELEVTAPPSRIDPWVGVDVGIARYATLSDGTYRDGVHAFKANQRKLARLQRAFARRTKGSRRSHKLAMRIARHHAHIAFIRADHAHKASTELVKNHGRIRMEDLRLVNMMKSAKGTEEKPGKMVAQKTGLNRHLADQGLRQFRTFVGYKLAWSGGAFEAVDPKHTSQKCHVCKHTARENRVSQSAFRCVVCGHAEHADVNAAKNIRDSVGILREESTLRRRRRPAREACTTSGQVA